ncbi:hypothetical protein HALLA_12115 [Halostagnicola larsenii XH-48]|uniref:C2H2-type domain-containing protein n=1 Tax=Halostagnicola larsenii XH-48 TaxID=797299 RepID=W0JQB7_9EURY|nr:hypothetical protein [Halostagnicola larsenii]AHG00921.1 hypothetical protein HALLA_11815 [Halostagnicola larsenii XH-48]AHG00970.1 hypothetical protein HALLA_12115 [Halostagnicola larsenii XH-48]
MPRDRSKSRTAETPDEDPREEDYDGLSEEQAFQVGVLTQLGRIATALETIADSSTDAGEQTSGTVSDGAGRVIYQCSSCDETVAGEEAAEAHATNDHNAPDDGSTWTALMDRVDA